MRVWISLTQKQINLFITGIMQMIQRASVITWYVPFMKTGRKHFGLEQAFPEPEGQRKED
jgi:hypothetical protein